MNTTTYIEPSLQNAVLEAWYDKAMLNIAADIPTLKSIISECPDKKSRQYAYISGVFVGKKSAELMDFKNWCEDKINDISSDNR